MSSEMKRCIQCGLLKEVDAFRPYTYARQNGTKGRYRLCRQCEAINSQYKRAKAIVDSPEGGFLASGQPMFPEVREAQVTVAKIEKLYAQLSARGLRVPTIQQPKEGDSTAQAVDMLLNFYSEDSNPTATVEYASTDVPADLSHWLNTSWEEWQEAGLSPEYLQETVYESLKAKYRPQTGIDKDKLLPVYDDTYKSVLNEILKRFDDYEEYMASQDQE